MHQAFAESEESHESDHEEYDVGAVGGHDDQHGEIDDTAMDPLGSAADANSDLHVPNVYVELFDDTVAGYEDQLDESNGTVADPLGSEMNVQFDGANECVTDYLQIEQVDCSGMVKNEVLEFSGMRASLENDVDLSSASDVEIVAEYYEEVFLAEEINVPPEAANEVEIDGTNQ